MSNDEMKPGRFYARDKQGRIVETPDTDAPDYWICRRIEDFKTVPADAGFAFCPGCGSKIVYNPARKVNAEKVCMQCAGIEPLPMDGDS